jgi:hypothetical protein
MMNVQILKRTSIIYAQEKNIFYLKNLSMLNERERNERGSNNNELANTKMQKKKHMFV